MTSILGIDLSSFQLDACLLIDDQPPVLRRERLGTSKEPLIERVRRVRTAVSLLTRISPRGTGWNVPDWVVIEEPAGKHGMYALLPVLGAITASIPSECQVAWRKASEWRTDLDCANTKAAGHQAVYDWLPNRFYNTLDEHQLDCLGISLAWRRILALRATPVEASPSRASSAAGDT